MLMKLFFFFSILAIIGIFYELLSPRLDINYKTGEILLWYTPYHKAPRRYVRISFWRN